MLVYCYSFKKYIDETFIPFVYFRIIKLVDGHHGVLDTLQI